MNFMQFCHQKGNFSTLNLRFVYFVQSKMSIKGIIMFLGMSNTRLERKILIILHFENGFLLTYFPLCIRSLICKVTALIWDNVYLRILGKIQRLVLSGTNSK